MWSVVAIYFFCILFFCCICFCISFASIENKVFQGERPAKQPDLSTKINPVCTSHTDRVIGVDVLSPHVAGATLTVQARFSHAQSRLPALMDGMAHSAAKPTQIKR